MSTQPVELERRGPIAVVRLNRPTKRNAIDEATTVRLEEIVGDLESATDVRAVVLTAAGEHTFCAGGDLDHFSSLASGAEGRAATVRTRAVLDRLANGPWPVLAALDGDMLGGGCEVALACHLRVAAAGIRFSFRPAALGALTGWGGGPRLFRQVGRSSALRLLLLAETVDAEEALRLGLVDRVVERGRAFDACLEWGERIAGNSAASIGAILELDHTIQRHGHGPEAAAVESRLFGELWDGEDFQRTLERWRRR